MEREGELNDVLATLVRYVQGQAEDVSNTKERRIEFGSDLFGGTGREGEFETRDLQLAQLEPRGDRTERGASSVIPHLGCMGRALDASASLESSICASKAGAQSGTPAACKTSKRHSGPVWFPGITLLKIRADLQAVSVNNLKLTMAMIKHGRGRRTSPIVGSIAVNFTRSQRLTRNHSTGAFATRKRRVEYPRSSYAALWGYILPLNRHSELLKRCLVLSCSYPLARDERSSQIE